MKQVIRNYVLPKYDYIIQIHIDNPKDKEDPEVIIFIYLWISFILASVLNFMSNTIVDTQETPTSGLNPQVSLNVYCLTSEWLKLQYHIWPKLKAEDWKILGFWPNAKAKCWILKTFVIHQSSSFLICRFFLNLLINF